MIDYHIHPGYSIDADPCSIDEYCRKAVASGFKELCFTPHLEVDPERRHLDWFVRVNGRVCPMENFSWLDYYFKDIENAREQWSGSGLAVKAGLEVGFDQGLEKQIETVISGYPFDFILGSVHCLDHLAISSRKDSELYFPGKELKQVVGQYFYVLEEAVDTGFFDCIGHVDLYRRYGSFYFGNDILSAHENLAPALFHKMASRGVGLEINSSSLRRGHKEYHPSFDMVKMAFDLGVRVFTVGSDAHRLTELGHGIDEAVRMLGQFGIRPATFKLRQIS